jgi:Ser-tRNA(Ala) deacylase AlaX
MIFPIIKKCPCCSKVLFIKTNGITYENNFKNIQDYTVKKRFNCDNCGQDIALFIHNKTGIQKLLWMEYLENMDPLFFELEDLKIKKKELLNKKADGGSAIKNISKEIERIKIQISEKQSKLIAGHGSENSDQLSDNHRFF